MKRFMTTVMVGTMLGGCGYLSPFHEPQVDAGTGWSNAPTVVSGTVIVPLPHEWWTRFGSPELNDLVALALKQNTDVAAAVARITEARAAVTEANESRLPTLDASANVGRSLTRVHGDTTGGNSYGAGVDASYELDLFGKNAANRKAARASARATEYDKDALTLLTAQDVAQAYFEILSLKDQVRIAQENLSLSQQNLNLIQVQFEAGILSGLQLAQEKSSVETSKADLSSLQEQLAQAKTALAVLTGSVPSGFEVKGTSLADVVVPAVPLSQPSSLAQNRPDILSAEASLEAAHADVAAARAALFPSINLGAGDSFSFDPAKNVLDISAGLLAPIFHSGALHAVVTGSKARQEELAQGYRGIVLNALKEVEDALAAVKSTQERQVFAANAQANAEEAYRLSRIQLQAGAIDMPTLLTAQETSLNAENSTVGTRLESLNAAVDLIAALGTGWVEEPVK